MNAQKDLSTCSCAYNNNNNTNLCITSNNRNSNINRRAYSNIDNNHNNDLATNAVMSCDNRGERATIRLDKQQASPQGLRDQGANELRKNGPCAFFQPLTIPALYYCCILQNTHNRLSTVALAKPNDRARWNKEHALICERDQ